MSQTVYVAMRYGRYPEDGDDELLGIFSTKEKAIDALFVENTTLTEEERK